MTVTTVAVLAWLSVFGVLTLWELRRLSARIDEVSEDAVQALAEQRAWLFDLQRDVEQLRDWRVPHLRGKPFDHEPAVTRLLAGEHGRPGAYVAE